MEPERPRVDRAVLAFLKSEALHPADFTIRKDGVIRPAPKLARRLVNLTARKAYFRHFVASNLDSQMLNRRLFIKAACSSLVAPAHAEEAVDPFSSGPSIIPCTTVESHSSAQGLGLAPQDTSNALSLLPLATQLHMTPFGTAFAKDRWLESDGLTPGTGLITLGVYFKGGTPEQSNLVMTAAQDWQKTPVGQRFAFTRLDAPKNSHIRIDFTVREGNHSFVGRENLTVASATKTMNLETLTPGMIQHEFGHVLGLRHEHQFPGTDLQWNPPQVIADMAKYGWKKPLTEEQILTKFDSTAICIGDPHLNTSSVMLYPILPNWCKIKNDNGKWVEFINSGNNIISSRDVNCLIGLYNIDYGSNRKETR
jgi:hypothetical protein